MDESESETLEAAGRPLTVEANAKKSVTIKTVLV
jgi:hypothetical protein